MEEYSQHKVVLKKMASNPLKINFYPSILQIHLNLGINCLHGCGENVQWFIKKTVPQERFVSYGTDHLSNQINIDRQAILMLHHHLDLVFDFSRNKLDKIQPIRKCLHVQE